MGLERKRLLKKHKIAIMKIKDVLNKGFYPARRNDLFYNLNHRNSIELDFLLDKEIDFRKITQFFKEEEIKLLSKNTIHAVVENVKWQTIKNFFIKEFSKI